MNKTTQWSLLVLMFGLVLMACDSTTEPLDNAESEITALIEAEDSLFSVTGLEDGESDSLFFDGRHGPRRPGFGGPILPWFVRREVESVERNVDVDVITTDSAVVTLTHQISGNLFIGIDQDTTDTIRVDTVWVKPFDITTTHKMQVVQGQLPPDGRPHMGARHQGWRIAGMTPIVTSSANSDLTVQNITFQNISSGESMTVSDPLNSFFTWESTPDFQAGDSVVVTVSVTNGDNSGTTVFTQIPRPRERGKWMLRFFDDGVAPDATADDGIYTGTWTFGRIHGMLPIMIDILDNDLLTVQEVPYNAAMWQFPFLVRFPHRGGPGGGR